MPSYPRTATARKTQNLSEAKLKRILEYNERQKQQLDIPRVAVSEASKSLIAYCKEVRDPLVPSVWGPVPKSEDPFTSSSTKNGCCTIL
ncbi:G-protein gamma subunit [Umbelopsis sp. PMI_123]|nr:G-protein gamma subunit [Umbelopsis sp. PMI_123]